MRTIKIVGCKLVLLLALAACGGGGDDGTAGGGGGGGGTTQPVYTAGVYQASSTLAARCLVPRTGTDPWTNRPWPDTAGSVLHEKLFLRSWTNELYLWFSEVADQNPSVTANTSAGVLDYFDRLKTTAVTASGRDKDEFHFTYDTDEYRELATSGSSLGYGISWVVLNPTPPREVVVEYVQAGTQAATGGVRRGSTVVNVNGVDVVNNNTQAGVDQIIVALFDPAPGSVNTMVFRDPGSSTTRTVNLTATQVAFDAVPLSKVIDVGATRVGYLVFSDHNAAAEGQLKAAVELLDTTGIDELVLDLRYNGGGFLDIASELAFMIAGPAATTGRTFERLQFNSKYPTTHPLTGQPITPVPFHSTTKDFSVPAGQPLPSLDLDRVFVLTSSRTCSASESVMNSLRGIGIEVIQIGGNTCGKPYGFYAQDNCGTTYFSIQFRGVNDAGFGDYAEGFSSTRAIGPAQANLPGCAATDDLTHELGDPLEGQLQVALARLNTGNCPTPPAGLVQPFGASQASDQNSPALVPPAPLPWENNRIYGR